MSPDHVVEIMRETLVSAVWLAAPILGAGLVVGLAVAVFQAATQIQESALAFVPKLAAIGGVLAVAGPWLLDKAVGFAVRLINEMALLAPGVGG